MAAAESNVDDAEERLARASIRAPFDGRLVRVYPEAGEYLRIGETTFRIIDDSQLKIVTYVSAAWLPRLRTGAVLAVEPDEAGTDRSVLKARIFSIAPAAEGKARTFRVEARCKDATGRWRPGMTARIRIPVTASKR